MTLIKLIETITPCDEEEKTHQTETIVWIKSGAPLFRIQKPDIPKKHLVSYFLPVDLEKEQCFLIHHRKANLWLPPGGHVEPNEHPQETVSREMEEELGTAAEFLLDNPLFLTVTDTVNEFPSHTDVSLWFIVEGKRENPFTLDAGEFFTGEWFDWEGLPDAPSEPHLNRFIQKLIASQSAAPLLAE